MDRNQQPAVLAGPAKISASEERPVREIEALLQPRALSLQPLLPVRRIAELDDHDQRTRLLGGDPLLPNPIHAFEPQPERIVTHDQRLQRPIQRRDIKIGRYAQQHRLVPVRRSIGMEFEEPRLDWRQR